MKNFLLASLVLVQCFTWAMIVIALYLLTKMV